MSNQPRIKPQRMWAVVLERKQWLEPYTFTYMRAVAECQAAEWNAKTPPIPCRAVQVRVTAWPTKRKARK